MFPVFFFLAQGHLPGFQNLLISILKYLDNLIIPSWGYRINIDFPATHKGPLTSYQYAKKIKYWEKFRVPPSLRQALVHNSHWCTTYNPELLLLVSQLQWTMCAHPYPHSSAAKDWRWNDNVVSCTCTFFFYFLLLNSCNFTYPVSTRWKE